MENPAVKWGVYLAIASIALLLIFYLVDPALIFSANTYVSIVVTIVMLVMACRESKMNSGGFASFGQMFQTAFLTWVIGSVIGVIFQYVLMNFIDPGLIELQKEISMEAIEKMSGLLGEEGMEAAIESIEESNPVSAGKMAIGMVIMMIPGAIVAAIIGAIMQKKNPAEF